jgi:hypothetical protein
MRYRTIAMFALFLGTASVAQAQTAQVAQPDEARPTLQQRLMPEQTTAIIAPASAEVVKKLDEQPAVSATSMATGSGIGLIIAGGALFIAGLLIDGDAGTVLAVTGAAVGAYGLYVYFQ